MSKRTIILSILIFIIFLFLMIPLVPVLMIRMDHTHMLIVLHSPITIKISYIHSVELLNITEIYVIKNNSFYLKTLIWPGYGAGLSSSINDINGSLNVIDGEYVLSNTNINIGDRLTINTTFMINATVRVNNYEINGKEIEFKIKKVSLLELLKVSLEGY